MNGLIRDLFDQNFGDLNTAVYSGGVGIASSGTYGYVCNGK